MAMRFQPHFLRVSAAVVGILAIVSSTAPSYAVTINGVYDYPAGGTPSATALANSSVDGAVVHVDWDSIEATEGTFTWTATDTVVNQIVNAGKKVELDLVPGRHTPSWVYTDTPGAASFSWIWNQSYGPGYCTTVKAPIPWDTVYESKFDAAITAFGNHYASNTSVSMVKLTGVNTATDEIYLPISPAHTSINGGQCYSNDDVANWNTAGYSQANIESAFEYFGDSWADAFSQDMSAMFIKDGFPNDTPNSPVETALIADGGTYFASTFIDQNNGWTSTRVGLGNLTGYQEGSALGTSFPAAVTYLLGLTPSQQPCPQFLEVYEADILLSSNATALQQAHHAVLNNCAT
jgi:hypothetical protein